MGWIFACRRRLNLLVCHDRPAVHHIYWQVSQAGIQNQRPGSSCAPCLALERKSPISQVQIHQECNPINTGLDIVLSSSWPRGPCQVKLSCGGHWCAFSLTSSLLHAHRETWSLVLITFWRDVEVVHRTPVTLKARNRWEPWHRRQPSCLTVIFQLCFPLYLVSEPLSTFTPYWYGLHASISYVP